MGERVHYVGMTKGTPIPGKAARAGLHPKQVEHEARRVDPRTGRSGMVSTWRGTCSCGWYGPDHVSPEQAQQDALSHQAGHPVALTWVVWPPPRRGRKVPPIPGQSTIEDVAR